MGTHGRFHLKTLSDLKSEIDRLGLSIPLAENIDLLGEEVELGGRTAPNRFLAQPMDGVDAVKEAWAQYSAVEKNACSGDGNPRGMIEALRNRQLCLAHAVYLEAVHFAINSGVGGRGSSVVLDRRGVKVHPQLDSDWRIRKEDETYRDRVQETVLEDAGRTKQAWVKRRPIPSDELWFETVWAKFRTGEIYR